MELKRKNRKRDRLLNKGLLSDLWVPVIMILSILYFSSEGKSDFVILVKIICAILALLISVIIYCKIPNIKNDFLKYLGMGFFYVGSIHFIEILIVTPDMRWDIKHIINMTVSYFEFIIIISSLVLYRKRTGVLLSNIIFLVNIMLVFIVSKLIVSKFIVVQYVLDVKLLTSRTLESLCVEHGYRRIIVIILITLITLYLVRKDKNIDCKTDKVWLIKIILLFTAYNMASVLEIIFNINDIYIQQMIRLTAYSVAYIYVEQKLLNNSYREVLDKLIGIQNIRKTKNNRLMKKERDLIELKKNIKKSQQRYEEIIESISDGVLVFENNRLVYINKNAMEYIWDKLIGESKDIDFKYVIGAFTNNDFDNNDINGKFIIDSIKKYNENNNITLKNISSTEKVMFIRNMTGVNELEKLREKRDKALVMETIKDEFYSNISHELRTPINVINSALQLNNLMLKENRIDSMVKNNNVIRQNCLRLIRTINNFIDTNRISEGFLEASKKIYNIVSIVENVVLASSEYMLLSGTSLVFDTELEDIYVECDIDHIERIMLNILSNSLKYGKLQGNIDVEIKSINNEVSISVKNDAPQIPEEKKKVIFEKFTKLDSSLARPSEGSGLGLYLSKELVGLNGGYIEMNSDSEIGNVFDIRFPIKGLEGEFQIDMEDNGHILKEKVNIEFSDIYFH